MTWPNVAGHIYVTGELDDAATRNTFVKDALLDLHRRTSPANAEVDVNQTTPSATYVDLGTIGPTQSIPVGTNGISLVSWSCALGSDTAGNGAWMSIAMSGAATLAPSDSWALNYTPGSPSVGAAFGISRFFAAANGLTTFTAKYRLNVAGGNAFFNHRTLFAQALGS